MKKIISLLLALVLLLGICACEKKSARVNDPNEFRIVTTFYPVYSVVSRLTEGADGVALENFTAENYGCMHGYALSSDDIERLRGSDLFIACGAGMEAFVGKSYLGIPQLELLDSGEDINNVTADGDENPHYWLSPRKASEQCDKILRTLVRLDAKNKDIYEKNAESYKAMLASVENEARERLAPLKGKTIVVYHDFLEFFAEDFGLDVISVTSDGGKSSDGISPEEAIAYMNANKITTIFYDKSFEKDDTLADIISATGASAVVLDAVTGGSLSEANDAYERAMKHNLDALVSNLK